MTFEESEIVFKERDLWREVADAWAERWALVPDDVKANVLVREGRGRLGPLYLHLGLMSAF